MATKQPIVLTPEILQLMDALVSSRRAYADTDHGKAEQTRLAGALAAICLTLDPGLRVALQAVNNRADTFTISTAYEVRLLAIRAERQMERAGIPKIKRAGATLTARPAGPTARSYGHSAASTVVVLRRSSAGIWTLASAERAVVHPKGRELFDLAVMPAARDDIVRNAMAPFRVLGEG